MLMSNNIWQDTWESARPIPVTSQSRLFNEAKEAHSILQYFKDLSVRDLIELVQPAVFHVAGYLMVSRGMKQSLVLIFQTNLYLLAKEVQPLIEDELSELCQYIAKSTKRAYSEDYFVSFDLIEY